jgi:hypothetical protein
VTQTLRRSVRAALLAATVAAGVLLAPATEAAAAPALPDVSPSQVAAVTANTGQATVFVRGTDNAIWYRTGASYGNWTWGPWKSIPGLTVSSGPSANLSFVSGPQMVTVVARGPAGNGVGAQAWLDATTGEPTTWNPPFDLRGNFTSALSAASLGSNRWAVAGRGGDGAVWQAVFGGTSGQSRPIWQSLGGAAYSAPSVEAEWTGSAWRWRTFVVGTDWKVWQRSANVDGLDPIGPWIGGWAYTSRGIGTPNTLNNYDPHYTTWPLITTGGADGSVVLADPNSSWHFPLGGWLTSVAPIQAQNDGSFLVFARGGDGALWYTRYSGSTSSPWYSLD